MEKIIFVIKKINTIFAVTKAYKQRLKALGVDPDKQVIEIFEDLLNLTEFLYKELEKSEWDRFKKEINRLKKPTN
jgi:hypothetical protein